MNRIPDTPCKKCGGNTTIHYGQTNTIEENKVKIFGMYRTCARCGFVERISALDEENKIDA